MLRNKFNQEVKDLYTENDKILMKETEEDTKRWRDVQRPRVARQNAVEMRSLPYLIYEFNETPIKTQEEA